MTKLFTKNDLEIIAKALKEKANTEGHPDEWDCTLKLEGVSSHDSEMVFALLSSELFPKEINDAISKLLRLCGRFLEDDIIADGEGILPTGTNVSNWTQKQLLSEHLDSLTAGANGISSWADDRCGQLAKDMFQLIDNLPIEDRMELASMINNHLGGSEDK